MTPTTDAEAGRGVTLILSFVVTGMIVLGMIGISLYGAKTLPSDARIAFLNRGRWYLPKTVALVAYPAFAAVIYGILVAVYSSPPKRGHSQYTGPWFFVFVFLALFQLWMITLARDSASKD
jgi:hypothetical protein